MATQEARTLLDSLMGGDRNAPLPKGAAVPNKNNKRKLDDNNNSGQLLLPGKRNKSCYDNDIDPLYTCWGVDIYDLFVNTKSDLGTNPYIVDKTAYEEYMNLPRIEKDKLGYEYYLYQKLQELVRQCDRTVARNKEKLKQEIQRKGLKNTHDIFVEEVDDVAVEKLAIAIIQVENMQYELNEKLIKLNEFVNNENNYKNKLEPLLNKQRIYQQKQQQQQQDKSNNNNDDDNHNDNDNNNEKTNNDDNNNKKDTIIVEEFTTDDENNLKGIQIELGQLTLQKQKLIYDVAYIISIIGPNIDNINIQRRQLEYVRSDTSTDKTVCVVSGNFMSARDADERIAAHYAGKQYVGWKLVRDKLKSMIQQYGPYGPPPPQRRQRNNENNGPPPPGPSSGPPPPRGGGGGGGRWERHGPPGGGGGGGYDRNRRSGSSRSGGGGGGDRWRR